MAIVNFKIRKLTKSSDFFTIVAIVGLADGSLLILWYEYQTKPEQLLFILILYVVLTIGAYSYAKIREKLS